MFDSLLGFPPIVSYLLVIGCPVHLHVRQLVLLRPLRRAVEPAVRVLRPGGGGGRLPPASATARRGAVPLVVVEEGLLLDELQRVVGHAHPLVRVEEREGRLARGRRRGHYLGRGRLVHRDQVRHRLGVVQRLGGGRHHRPFGHLVPHLVRAGVDRGRAGGGGGRGGGPVGLGVLLVGGGGRVLGLVADGGERGVGVEGELLEILLHSRLGRQRGVFHLLLLMLLLLVEVGLQLLRVLVVVLLLVEGLLGHDEVLILDRLARAVGQHGGHAVPAGRGGGDDRRGRRSPHPRRRPHVVRLVLQARPLLPEVDAARGDAESGKEIEMRIMGNSGKPGQSVKPVRRRCRWVGVGLTDPPPRGVAPLHGLVPPGVLLQLARPRGLGQHPVLRVPLDQHRRGDVRHALLPAAVRHPARAEPRGDHRGQQHRLRPGGRRGRNHRLLPRRRPQEGVGRRPQVVGVGRLDDGVVGGHEALGEVVDGVCAVGPVPAVVEGLGRSEGEMVIRRGGGVPVVLRALLSPSGSTRRNAGKEEEKETTVIYDVEKEEEELSSAFLLDVSPGTAHVYANLDGEATWTTDNREISQRQLHFVGAAAGALVSSSGRGPICGPKILK